MGTPAMDTSDSAWFRAWWRFDDRCYCCADNHRFLPHYECECILSRRTRPSRGFTVPAHTTLRTQPEDWHLPLCTLRFTVHQFHLHRRLTADPDRRCDPG